MIIACGALTMTVVQMHIAIKMKVVIEHYLSGLLEDHCRNGTMAILKN